MYRGPPFRGAPYNSSHDRRQPGRDDRALPVRPSAPPTGPASFRRAEYGQDAPRSDFTRRCDGHFSPVGPYFLDLQKQRQQQQEQARGTKRGFSASTPDGDVGGRAAKAVRVSSETAGGAPKAGSEAYDGMKALWVKMHVLRCMGVVEVLERELEALKEEGKVGKEAYERREWLEARVAKWKREVETRSATGE